MIKKSLLFFLLFQTNILLPNFYHTFVLQNNIKNINRFISEHRTGLNGKSNKFRNTPLCLAAELNRLKIIPIFLQNGADRLKTNNSKQTPLHLAANSKSNNFITAMDMLISINTEEIDIPAFLNMQDINGDTILHLLARRQNVTQNLTLQSFILYLIRHGADLFATNSAGQTSLHVAAKSGNLNVIKALLHKNNFVDLVFRNIYVNIQDTQGSTALHLVIENKCLEEHFIHLVSTLTTKKASILLKNNQKLSAIDVTKVRQQKLIPIIESPSVEQELSQKLYAKLQSINIVLLSLNQIASKQKNLQSNPYAALGEIDWP